MYSQQIITLLFTASRLVKAVRCATLNPENPFTITSHFDIYSSVNILHLPLRVVKVVHYARQTLIIYHYIEVQYLCLQTLSRRSPFVYQKVYSLCCFNPQSPLLNFGICNSVNIPVLPYRKPDHFFICSLTSVPWQQRQWLQLPNRIRDFSEPQQGLCSSLCLYLFLLFFPSVFSISFLLSRRFERKSNSLFPLPH